MDPLTSRDLTLDTARRAALRVVRRDFARPLRLGTPIPDGAFERLEDAADDYRLASEDYTEAQCRAAMVWDDAS